MHANTTDAIALSAWQTTKTYWKPFIAFPTAVLAGIGILEVLLAAYARGGNPGLFVIFLILLLAQIVFAITFSTALTGWISQVHQGKKEVNIEEGLRYGLTRFWGVLGTGLLTSIKVLLWSLLLILPGIYKGLLYSQSIKITQLEKISGGDANRLSERLVKDAGLLRTLGNMVAMQFISTLILYVYLLVVLLIVVVLRMGSAPISGFVGGVLTILGFAVMTAFLFVFFCTQYLVFREENKSSFSSLAKSLESVRK